MKRVEGTFGRGIFYEDIGGFGGNLAAYPLGRYSLKLVASPEIKQRYPEFITPDRIIPDYTIELWSIPTIKNLVKNNMGISLLPVFVAAKDKNKWISPVMQLFIDLCREIPNG